MDHTKKTIFAGFVNNSKGSKYWVDGHFEYSEDVPTLFRFNTKEEKTIVQEVAQSYLDNWGMDSIELVIFEVKTRHQVMLQKRSPEESQPVKGECSEIKAPKKRGRRPAEPAIIQS